MITSRTAGHPRAVLKADSASASQPGRFLTGIALLLLLLLLASTPLSVPAGDGAAEAGIRPYWVFFRDKGPVELDESEILKVVQAVTPETWARRSAAGTPLPTVQDLDLWEPYVEAVAREGRLRRRTRWLNGVSAEFTWEAVRRVRDLEFVSEVRPVAVGRSAGIGPEFASDGTPLGTVFDGKIAPSAGAYPYGSAHEQLQEIGVPGLHAMGFTGNRVLMMIMDTGFRKDHEAFTYADVLAEWDFVFNDGNTQDERGDIPGQHDHGTSCWSIAGGRNADRILGPAHGSTFVLAKTEDLRSETQAEEDNYVAALEWAESLGVAVISASLIYLCFDDGFCYDYPLKDGETAVTTQAVNIAASRGILCVNAMGNYGDNGPRSLGTPADAFDMLAVGAVDSENLIAVFSSRGPTDDGRIKPEVVARGVATFMAHARTVNTYVYGNGTSMATPLVAGAAALLAEAHPGWGPMDIRESLMMTADRRNRPDNSHGWGRINLEAALEWAPIVHPLPFDLVAPDAGVAPVGCSQRFVWRQSHDPAAGAPLAYTVWVRELRPGGREWLLDAGSDTTLAPSLALDRFTDYEWEVRAESVDGYVRLSRQTHRFTTGGSTVPVESCALSVIAGPNPFTDTVRFRAVGDMSGASFRIYDPVGRRVASGDLNPWGAWTVWDGRDNGGEIVPSGVYFLWVKSGSSLARTTLVRLRTE